jgi:hypothetical protein
VAKIERVRDMHENNKIPEIGFKDRKRERDIGAGVLLP